MIMTREFILSERIPRGIFTPINVKDMILMINPSSTRVAPISVICSGRIGRVVSDARNIVIEERINE
jgi:hypothetical protein